MVYLQRIQWVLVRTYIWFHLPDRVINVGKNSIHGSHGNGVQTQSDKDENSNMSLKGVERGYMKHEANSRMLQSAQLLICFSHCDFLLFLLLASQTAPRLWKPTREIHTEKNAFSIVFTGLELMNLSTDRIPRNKKRSPWLAICLKPLPENTRVIRDTPPSTSQALAVRSGIF